MYYVFTKISGKSYYRKDRYITTDPEKNFYGNYYKEIYELSSVDNIFSEFSYEQVPLVDGYLIEVEPDYSQPNCLFSKSDGERYLANKIIVKQKYPLTDVSTFEMLLNQTTNHVDKLIIWAYEVGHLDLLKLLCEKNIPYEFKFDKEDMHSDTRLFYFPSNADKSLEILENDIKIKNSHDFLPRYLLNDQFEVNKWVIDNRDYFKTDCYLYLDYESSENKSELTQYIMATVDLDYTITLSRTIKFVDLAMAQLLVDHGAVLDNSMVVEAFNSENIEVVKYLIEDMGLDYDFNQLVTNSQSKPMIKYLLDLGNEISDEVMTIMITNMLLDRTNKKHIIKYIEFLIDNGLNEKHIPNTYIENLVIDDDFNSKVFCLLVNRFPEFIKQINLDNLLLYAIDWENLELVKVCIDNKHQIDFNEYINLACEVSSDDIIEYLVSESNTNIKDIGFVDKFILKKFAEYQLSGLKYMIKNGHTENLFGIFERACYYDHYEVLPLIWEKIQENHILIGNITEIITRSIICEHDYTTKFLSKLDLALCSEDEYSSDDQLILAVIKSDTIMSKKLCLEILDINTDHQFIMKLLFVTILKSNIEVLEYLLDLLAGLYSEIEYQNYLESAFVLSMRQRKILKYLVEKRQINYHNKILEARYFIKHDMRCYYCLNYLILLGCNGSMDSDDIDNLINIHSFPVIKFLRDNKYLMVD